MRLLNQVIIVFIFTSSAFSVHYPGMSLRYQIGLGDYAQGDLHALQADILAVYHAYDIPVEVVDDYPSYQTYQVQWVKRLGDKYSVGVFWDHASTGGKIHYRDYSGEMEATQSIFRDAYGLLGEYHLIQGQSFSLRGTLQGSIIYSTLTMTNYLEVLAETDQTSYQFESIGLGVEPGLSCQVQYGGVLFGVNLSYQYTVSSPLQFNSLKESLTLENNKEVWADWSGIRQTIIIGYEL